MRAEVGGEELPSSLPHPPRAASELTMPIEQIHPVVVHFPIVLLLVGFLLDGIFLLLRRTAWADVTFLLVAAGVGAAFAAGLTGQAAAHAIEPLAPPLKAALERHHEFAGVINFLGTGMLALRMMVRFRRQTVPLVAYLAIGLLTLSLLALTARRGGILVFDLGAGVALTAPVGPAI